MSPIKARRAFPCWDEPALKATFNLSISHWANYTAVSNMPVKNTKIIDEKLCTTFETTPPMSTYLLAFVISDYNCTSNENKSFNVCAKKALIPEIKFIQQVGEKVFPYLIEYTGIPYALPKIDNFAIAEPKSNMENWGLVIYRESNVAINNNTACQTKEATVELVIHELSHQWFGNLVSPSWWKYLWLKEGLARYFQFYIGNKVRNIHSFECTHSCSNNDYSYPINIVGISGMGFNEHVCRSYTSNECFFHGLNDTI